MPLIKILIVACLLGIVASLFSGLFHLVNDKGQSNRMLNSLTLRIVLSVALFILLFIGWRLGMLQPHTIN
jgi:succinate dehydrogenase/fumarate reductase cytochrome b subunit